MSWTGRLTSPAFMLGLLEWLMDAIAFSALLVTNEVKSGAWIIAIGLIALRVLTRYRLKTRLFAMGFFALLFGTTYLILFRGFHPVLGVVQAAPILHALVIFSRTGNDYLGWRVGVAFTEIVIAAAITPDFAVPLLVFCFVMTAIALASCHFVMSESLRSNRGVKAIELPPGFPRIVFRHGLIIFISAAVIFPILPRFSRQSNVGPMNSRSIGYTEDVDLSKWVRLSSEDNSSAAVRIIIPDHEDLASLIYGGLLRSRVLNRFDGKSWTPDGDAPRIGMDVSPHRVKTIPLTFQREALNSPSLPVPYGQSRVMVEQYGIFWLAGKTPFHELSDQRFKNLRVNYQVHLPIDDQDRALFLKDLPRESDLSVPPEVRTPRLRQLTQAIFGKLTDPRKKAEALLRWLKNQEFTASQDLPASVRAKLDPQLSPLENFIFNARSGHCELFASAVATMLRMGGVPTRVVAGFRVSRFPVGSVLTIRMSDAHAWVEVYVPSLGGWFPLDPTPRILLEPGFIDWIRDGYDWMSAKWTLYLLNYGEDSTLAGELIRSVRQNFNRWSLNPTGSGSRFAWSEWQLPILGAVVLGLALFFFLTRSRSRSPSIQGWQGIRSLRREREKFEALTRDRPEALNLESAQLWQQRYARLRFGKTSIPRAEDIQSLAEYRRALKESLNAEAPRSARLS